MWIHLKEQTLMQLLADAVDIGILRHARVKDPRQDRIKRADAQRYLKSVGIRPATLDRWTQQGLLDTQKNDGGANAAVWYSLSQIKQVIATARLLNGKAEFSVRPEPEVRLKPVRQTKRNNNPQPTAS